MLNLEQMSKEEIIRLINAYDNYICNDNEEWNKDRQPVCLDEFYDNEYQILTE